MSEPTPPAEAASKKRGSKLTLFLVVGVVVTAGAGGAYWWLNRGAAVEAAEATPKHKPAAERGIVAFDPFVVNLADSNASRFLRASVQVVVSEPEVAAHIQEKRVELMQMRSAILELLTVETSDHLVTPEGKAALKKAITERVSPLVNGAEVVDVLFSDFVIQFEAPDQALPLVTTGNDVIARMAEVRCAVDFIIGTGTLKVEECLRLGPHGVVPLIQAAGSDLRVEVHGVTIATGEIVIIDDALALRISRMSPPEGTEST